MNIKVIHEGKEIHINGASSITNPHDNTVMFVGKKCAESIQKLMVFHSCLVFVLDSIDVPKVLFDQHIIEKSDNPRKAFGKFLEENKAEELPPTDYKNINGALISVDAKIGKNTIIMPFAFIDRDVIVGDNCLIRSGARLLPHTFLGNNCVVHENVVLGTIGLAYEDEQRIPQLGGLKIGNNCAIGASTIIARGAIDNTVIGDYVAIDANCFVSHNDILEDDVKVVGGSTLFGSVRIGKGTFVSGNSVIRNGLSIGRNAFVGMGAVVVKSVPDNTIVMGNPAHEKKEE